MRRTKSLENSSSVVDLNINAKANDSLTLCVSSFFRCSNTIALFYLKILGPAVSLKAQRYCSIYNLVLIGTSSFSRVLIAKLFMAE